jgi:hypothetical protein
LSPLQVKGAFAVMSEPYETPKQRRARYLRLAAEAQAAAEECRGGELREAYLALARSWALLANDVKVDGEA